MEFWRNMRDEPPVTLDGLVLIAACVALLPLVYAFGWTFNWLLEDGGYLVILNSIADWWLAPPGCEYRVVGNEIFRC